MDTISEYNEWKARRQQTGVGAAQVVLGAVDASPDEVAGDLNLANDFGKATGNPVPPLPVVKEYRNVFQRRVEAARNQTTLSSSPRLAEWLVNTDNAALARDNIEGLSWFEGFGRGASNTAARAGQGLAQMGNQFMLEQTAERAADRKLTFGELLDDQKLVMRDMQGNKIDTGAGPVEYAGAFARWLDARYADLIGTDDAAAAAEFAGRVKANVDAMKATPKSSIASAFEAEAMVEGATLGQAVSNFGAAFVGNPIGGISWALETAGEVAPQLGAALGATIVTRNPAVGAAVGAAGSYATERYRSPAEFFEEKGFDLSKPDDVHRMLADPEIMREAAERGIIRGLIIGAFDAVSMGVAGRSLAGNPMVEALAQGASQMILGSSGEYTARVAAGQEMDWNEVLAEGFGELATAPIDMGIAGRKFIGQRQSAAIAEGNKVKLGELSTRAAADPLRNRMPDKFREFVARAAEGGPVENVFVPAEQFATYFQGVGVDPFALVDEFDGMSRDDLEIALAGGGDLKIPTATYAAKIAGSEHDAFLMENMRFDPDEFTATEAAEFNAKAADAMDEAFELSERLRLQEEELRTFEQEIYDTMVSRLRSAGRSTDVATTEATLYPAFYRVMAERSVMGVDEFMARYPLPQVEGERPEGIQYRDVDALNRTLAEARAQKAIGAGKRGPSLLEFISDYGGINDVGGELKSRDARTVKRGKGKKTLKLARGTLDGVRDFFGGPNDGKKFGVDDVALAAIDAGYMANDPAVIAWKRAQEDGAASPDVVAALWAAIDAELRGDVQSSANAAPDAAVVDTEATLDGIEQYLSTLGVTLDDDDATIRAAVEAADAGRQYGQGEFLFQSAGPGPRGSIQFPAAGVGKGDTIIRLFQSADLSTMLHESGHYFLTVLRDLADNGEANAAADFGAVKAWWRLNASDVAKDGARVMTDVALTADDVIAAIDNGTTGDVLKDAAVDVGMQEQWARAFEAYLMEGKSPNVELRSAFEKFRAWLISIYRKLAGLNVQPTDELRGVFDRMLATDEEIAAAVDRAGPVGPTFATAEAMGLSPDDYDAFMKLRARAEDDAKAKLLGEIMAPLKREREKWFKEERAKVREEVAREVNAHRHFRAIEWMGNRRWIGEGQPIDMPDIRLSKDLLVARYGEGVLKTLPRGKQTVYAVEGGIDPDEAAGWFGFGSGDEMVRAMERAPKRPEAIDAETDRVMRERHGDALNDGDIETIALDAVHTERRGEWIAAELKAITEIAGADAGMTAKEARATARATIARMRVRDAVAANRFLTAERKAAEEAGRLGAMLARDSIWLANAKRRMTAKARAAVKGAGTIDAAIAQTDKATKSAGNYNETVAKLVEAKRRQLLNHALYMEARAVADEVDKAETYVAKLGKKTVREKLAGAGRRDNARIDYLGAIDEILDRYDFRKLSGKAEDRRGSLKAYIEAMTAAGRENELAIPESVLADVARKPYKTMPVEEMRGVVDTLKNLEHTARRWNDLVDAVNKRHLDEAVADIEEAFDANMPKRPPSRVKSSVEALRNAGRQFLDLVLNAGTLLREIDGFKDEGAAYSNIKAPIDAAMNRLIVRKQDAAAALESIYSVYSKEDRRAMAVREHLPALGYALSKWERIAVALNLGNEGNRQRMTDTKVRGHLTDAQIDAVLATLDARDADFVQSVWDYLESFRGDLAARERRTTGIEPKWVEASPVTIAGKSLRGGYFPLKYDARLSALARDDQAQDIAQSLAAGRFGKAQTHNGHTKERAKSSGRSVELDMSVLHRHVNQVIYDLELSEAVANSWRILQDGRIRTAFTDSGRQADFDALEIWLKDVAEGELRSADLVGRGARMLKSNFTAAKLAFNLSTVAVQITGLAQSMVVVGKKDFSRGVMASLRAGVADEIAAKSPYMATRQTTFNKDIYDFYNDPATGPTASRWGEIKKEVIGPAAFWLMTKVQWHLVDVPTWQAGYIQGLRRNGNDEAKAIAHADAIVKRAQASGLFPDRSAVERGSVSRTARQNDVVRLFTALGSYMFAKFNVAYERSARAKRTIATEGASMRSAQEALSWSLDMAFLFTFEAVLYAAIKGRLPDDDDEDDEGWTAFLAKETAFGVMGTIPGLRDIASVMSGFEGGGAYGAITKDFAAPFAQVKQGEVDRAFVKSIINATGLITGLPATQANRIIDAGWRQAEGDEVSPLEYLIGRSGR